MPQIRPRGKPDQAKLAVAECREARSWAAARAVEAERLTKRNFPWSAPALYTSLVGVTGIATTAAWWRHADH
ncbi:hypothetical protein AB0J55_01265 [Amycolatopsis sp. NPDC049688]|uniref:hypothetical protein n=1 Tax=Amycolatopsis sp. NPDC049688 TaxID=3154733 RepID=UPI0034223A29